KTALTTARLIARLRNGRPGVLDGLRIGASSAVAVRLPRWRARYVAVPWRSWPGGKGRVRRRVSSRRQRQRRREDEGREGTRLVGGEIAQGADQLVDGRQMGLLEGGRKRYGGVGGGDDGDRRIERREII